ncbi:MAG: hypothetical protein IKS87_00985 [Lachnospiraceae bacterium]|nr:hypothetical protein [Lachnospiraceae bacterium]
MTETFLVIRWILVIFLVSFLMRPYLRVRVLKFADAGFAFSAAFGLMLSFFVSWFLSAILGYPFDERCYIVLIALGILPFAIRRKIEYKKESLIRFVCGFLFFTLIFLAILWVRTYKPALDFQTEQYMDYGFVQAIYRQKCAVPEDIWYAGNALNYYYLGQACTAYLCRLSGVAPEYGYNLMLSTIFALVGTMVFVFVKALLDHIFTADAAAGVADEGGSKTGGGIRTSIASCGGAAVSMLAACFAGNGHYLVHGIFYRLLTKITGHDYSYRPEGYFFPDSTVYVGTYPDLPDKGKNECLAYSVILGDLHAHMINLLFVLPLLVFAFDLALDREEKSLARSVLDPRIFSIAGLLSYFRGANFWDFPIYYVIAGALILFRDLVVYKRKGLLHVACKGVLIYALAKILILPFEVNFTKMASKIRLCQNHTPLYKFAVLWAVPIVIALGLLAELVIDYLKRASDEPGESVDQADEQADEIQQHSLVHRERRSLGKVLLFHPLVLPVLSLAALILCAIGLTIVPEIIYVEDIYGEEYARFNTMFKLTYQAFLHFGILTGIAAGVWFRKKRWVPVILTTLVTVLLSGYLFTSIHQFMGNVFKPEGHIGISATEFLTKDASLYAEMNAIHLILEDEREHVRILEGGGESYTPDCKISAFTGAPTYVGWHVHEWMWRGSWDIVAQRLVEVQYFYESGNLEWCKDFIGKHGIDYVFAGPREYEQYRVNTDGFAPFLREVFRSEEGYVLYRVVK